ncbi:hypothetical protein [Streptomyces eurythermus]
MGKMSVCDYYEKGQAGMGFSTQLAAPGRAERQTSVTIDSPAVPEKPPT